jgi:hypothetical protein
MTAKALKTADGDNDNAKKNMELYKTKITISD